MIVQEILNDTLVRTYSDKDVYIHGGDPERDWIDAIDLIENNMEYTETNTPIPSWPTNDDYIKIGKMMMGVDE